MSEQGFQTKPEEQRESETDTSQLLRKSSLLVGEVNSIINGELLAYAEELVWNYQQQTPSAANF